MSECVAPARECFPIVFVTSELLLQWLLYCCRVVGLECVGWGEWVWGAPWAVVPDSAACLTEESAPRCFGRVCWLGLLVDCCKPGLRGFAL